MRKQPTAVAFQNKNDSLESPRVRGERRTVGDGEALEKQVRFSGSVRPSKPATGRTGAFAIVAAAVAMGLRLSTANAVDLPARAFEIRPQPVSTALKTFADQAGMQLIFTERDVWPLETAGVHGNLAPRDALATMLRGTGLEFEFTANNVIVVRRPQPLSLVKGTGGQAPSVADDSTSLLHSGEKVPQGLWSRFRLAQAETSSTEEQDEQTSSQQLVQTIQEVIVTAQKRKERLIDVPQAVTVLSADDLARTGATQFRDFANTVPGMSFQTFGAGFTQVSLRGVTTGSDVGPAVAIYVDEVPYGSSSAYLQAGQTALDVGLFDMERIEVLRGPQGTLYGASSMGGLLKYVTLQPDTNRYGADVRVGTSSTRDGDLGYNGAAAVNIPISDDKAALRASSFYSHDGGYINNVTRGEEDVDRANIYGGRADLLLTPTELLSIRLTGFLQNISREGEATADHSYTGTPLDGSLDQRRPFAEPFDQRFRLLSSTIAYDFDGPTLTSISSYQTVRTDIFYDLTAVFLGTANLFGPDAPYSGVGNPVALSMDKFTQEVRLAQSGGKALEWALGAFYTQEDAENDQEFALLDSAGQPAPNTLFFYSGPSRYEEYAAFGDVTYHFSEKFDLSGGLRYARNRQRFEQFGAGAFGQSSPLSRSSENVATYLANARYHYSDRAMAYFRFATGYRPGGPNFLADDPATGLPIAPPTFEADKLQSYEIGFKAETADRRFTLDLATYYIDWENIQISVTRGGGFSVLANAPGGANVRGVELALTGRPASALTLSGAFAYQDAQMSEADSDLRALKGERLPSVPRFTGTVNADYAFAQGGLQPTIGATLRHVSDRWAAFNGGGRPQYYLPDYTAVDVRAGVALGAVDAQLYVRNAFDEQGQLSALFTQFGTARVAMLQPRTFGISLTTRF